jgi:hypothetical protein
LPRLVCFRAYSYAERFKFRIIFTSFLQNFERRKRLHFAGRTVHVHICLIGRGWSGRAGGLAGMRQASNCRNRTIRQPCSPGPGPSNQNSAQSCSLTVQSVRNACTGPSRSTGYLILLSGPGEHNQKYFDGGPKQRKVEGGCGVTRRDEYFVGGRSKRFGQDEKVPFTFVKRHLRDVLIPFHRRRDRVQ